MAALKGSKMSIRISKYKPESVVDLDSALDYVQVHFPGMWENNEGPRDWFAVSYADLGIVAYFSDENDACAFRLNIINVWLNYK